VGRNSLFQPPKKFHLHDFDTLLRKKLFDTIVKITTHQAQGRRPYQEDCLTLWDTPRGAAYAVFDGHCGDSVSTVASREIAAVWRELESDDIPATILAVIAEISQRTEVYPEGSTLSLAFVPTGTRTVHTAVLGDSPILVLTDSGWFQSVEHNVRTNLVERDAAATRGGVYCNGYMCNRHGDGLQMGRALGDVNLGFVSHEPELAVVEGAKILVVASDGVFDPGHADEEASRNVQLILEGGGNAKELVEHALKIPTYDNASAIVVRFDA